MRKLTKENLAAMVAGRKAKVPPLEARFWAKVNKAGANGCWEWTGATAHGYGQVVENGKLQRAHRLVFRFTGDRTPAPRDMLVDHLCKNRKCCNPEHLRFVTHRQNAVENNNSPLARNANATQCPQGHPYEGDNFFYYTPPRQKNRHGNWMKKPLTQRQCRVCYLLTKQRPEQSVKWLPSMAKFLNN